MGKIHDRIKKRMQANRTDLGSSINRIIEENKIPLHIYDEWKTDRSTKEVPGFKEISLPFTIKFVIGFNPRTNMISVVTLSTRQFHMDFYLGSGYKPLAAGYLEYDPKNLENMRLLKYSEGYGIGTSAKAFPYLKKHLSMETDFGELTEHTRIVE